MYPPQQMYMTPYQLFFACLQLGLSSADHMYEEDKAVRVFHKLVGMGTFNGNERTVAEAVVASQQDPTQPTIPELINQIISYEYDTGPRPQLYIALGLVRERR